MRTPETTARHAADRELLRFLLVGATGAMLYVVLSTLARSALPVPAEAVAVGVHVLLIPPMFLAQRALTFRSRGARAPEFLKYALLQIISISASTALLARLMTGEWLMDALVFTAIAATSSLLSFVICRFAIFASPSATKTAA